MEKAFAPWSVPVNVQDIPNTGLHLKIEAPDAVRAALAELANVREIMRVAAVFDISHRGPNIHVAGQLNARVGQICVGSLEPMESEIEEPIDLLFSFDAAVTGREVELSVTAEEPPEPLVQGKVDLGALATEFLLLGIDPYPRKPGVEFTPPEADNDGSHPFAALEVLKKRSDSGNPN